MKIEKPQNPDREAGIISLLTAREQKPADPSWNSWVEAWTKCVFENHRKMRILTPDGCPEPVYGL
jgi:hypothetical protein